MPTGYTSKLYEGEQSFRDFALGAARAFAMSQRDDPDGPIRVPVLDTSYHDAAIARATERIAAIGGWAPGDAERHARLEHEQAMKRFQEHVREQEARNARLSAARKRACLWEAPTPEHREFQKFMLSQLDMTLEETRYGLNEPKPRTSDEYRDEKLAAASRDLTYHLAQRAAQVERHEKSVAWVKALIEALPEGES